MVKICRKGLLKLNFEIIPKKRILQFLQKISTGHGWRVSGIGCYTSKFEKKVKITAPLNAYISLSNLQERWDVFSEETWKDRRTNVEQMFPLVISRRGEERHVYLGKA